MQTPWIQTPLDADPPGHVTCDACWKTNPPPPSVDNITLLQTSFADGNNKNNKNAFQWDAYDLFFDHIPACAAQGGVSQHALHRGAYPSTHLAGGAVYPSRHWARGCLLGRCLPMGVCLGGGICPGCVCVCVWWTPHGPEADIPLVNRMTDRCKNITLSQLRCGR